jgi:hypothetical protein
MDLNHYLRTNFLPKSYNFVGFTPTQTVHKNPHTQSNTYQNVMIGGGMMTVRVPNTPTQPVYHQHVQPVHHQSVQPVHHQTAQPVHQPAQPVQHPPVTNNANWASGGVIIVENEYHFQNGTKCQAIFLGLNPSSGKYELFYGKRDSTDSDPSETALRECVEESSNMFRLRKSMFDNSFCVKSPNQKHCAYVIRVNAPTHGIQSKVFHQNQAILLANGAHHSWTEVSNITRININEAIKQGILTHTKGDFAMYDVYNNWITIFSRDAEFIADALRRKFNLLAPIHHLTFIPSYDARINGGRNKFLNNTSFYI